MPRILIVDDDISCLQILKATLQYRYELNLATNGEEALKIVAKSIPDLIILDIQMPVLDGFETCSAIRRDAKTAHIPILMITSLNRKKNEKTALALGANDFISKPIIPEVVLRRVQNTLALRNYQQHLETLVELRTQQFLDSQEEILRRLSVAGDYRDDDTGTHVMRMELYSLEILEFLNWKKKEDRQLAGLAIRMHDIGKIGIPDNILFKPGPLNNDEWQIMKRHTTIGHDIIGNGASNVLRMARTVALNHHERWDGSGYPRGLKKNENDLISYVTQIADVYDALRAKRPYKRSFSHDETINCILNDSSCDTKTLCTHFHPEVLKAFRHIEEKLLKISEKYLGNKNILGEK